MRRGNQQRNIDSTATVEDERGAAENVVEPVAQTIFKVDASRSSNVNEKEVEVKSAESEDFDVVALVVLSRCNPSSHTLTSVACQFIDSMSRSAGETVGATLVFFAAAVMAATEAADCKGRNSQRFGMSCGVSSVNGTEGVGEEG